MTQSCMIFSIQAEYYALSKNDASYYITLYDRYMQDSSGVHTTTVYSCIQFGSSSLPLNSYKATSIKYSVSRARLTLLLEKTC